MGQTLRDRFGNQSLVNGLALPQIEVRTPKPRRATLAKAAHAHGVKVEQLIR